MTFRTNRKTRQKFWIPVYHGTSRTAAENILKTGLNPTSEKYARQASLTTDKESAKAYARHFSDSAVIRVNIPLREQLDYVDISPSMQDLAGSRLLKPGETYFRIRKRIPPEYLVLEQ